MIMLNVVIEELGFGRESRRERPMSIHIPYLRHVADAFMLGKRNVVEPFFD